MRICVFGAGSLGSALGGLLAAKNEVVLIGRRPHVKAVMRGGLTILGDVRRRVRIDAHEGVEGLPSPDLLIVATKAYDTEAAVEACSGWSLDSALVLTLQNGLGNLEILRKWKGSKAFGGTTTLGANLLRPGVVRISGLGRTCIGSDSDRKGALTLADTLSSCGIPTTIKDDIQNEIWQKAVVSASINPLTAILRVENGVLLQKPDMRRMLDSVVRESVGIASSHGIRMSADKLASRARQVARDTSRNRSSMLQDIERGKRTEISMINGALCRVADSEGVNAPLNRTLYAIVEEMERRIRPGKG